MLRLVVFALFFSKLNAHANCSHTTTCPVVGQEDFIKDSLKTVEHMKQEKDFQFFLTHSFEQRETVLKNDVFQEAVREFQQPAEQSFQTKPSHLYIFVSFSLGEKALFNLANEAKQYGAILVLRGFKEGSYAKTVKTLQAIIIKTGQGVLVDPELFSLFAITAVPTYILTKPFQLLAQERVQSPLHDRLMGHVSIQYALESFSQSGDLREEAQALLDKRDHP